jgi:periplasmic protein TonB
MGYQALLFCPDEKTARIVTQVLNDLDFTVEPCTEPFAAVKKLMAQHFDAVVVDCDNEQNATLLFKSARNSSSNQSSLAVAVVEGQAGVAKAFRIGANLVLTKPINVEQAKGTLRVARGLLRKGSDGPKASAPAASVAPTGQVSNVPKQAPAAPPRGNVPSAPPARPLTPAASARPSTPAIPAARPSAAPAMPAMAAPTQRLDVDDADGILEPDFEPASPEPALESNPATLSGTPSAATATATSKFPWQPSPKMAEPMASALRRAAEAAGQMKATETVPPKSAVAPPALEKRPSAMSGAMFQAQGHAAAPARAVEKPSPAAVAPAIEEVPTVSKPSVREVSEPKPEKPIVDTTRADVPPPTFFPGAYDSDEVEGGGKTKAIVIVAAVVLLACSAGYLSWKNSSNKSAPAAAKQSVSTTTTPADAASTKDGAPAAPQTTDITLGPSAPVPAAAAHTTASTKPSAAKEPAPAKESATAKGSAPAKESEPAAEPEVTQRLIVRSDTGHTSKPANSQDQENVQAPSAMDVGSAADTKALANISSAPVNVPKPSAQMLRVSQGVMEGLVLKRVQPRYPTQALQMRIQGPVQLQATITKNGDIQNLKVVSGDSVLAHAAQEAVRQWKYKPYYLDGEPVQIETQILVNFKLPN